MNKKIQKVVKLIEKLTAEGDRLENCGEGSKKIPKILEKINVLEGELNDAIVDAQAVADE
jgi:predicted  nucleic acid-binding Zn-ribbon protein